MTLTVQLPGSVRVDILADRYTATLCDENGSGVMAVGPRFMFLKMAIEEAKQQAERRGWPYTGVRQ